jgi:predicted small metal-binding protein
MLGFGKKKFYFSCSDIGMNCGYEIRGAKSEEEVLEILKIHAEKAHKMKLNDKTIEEVKMHIKKK